CDVAIVGGGLAGSLTAMALAAKHPGIDVRLVEGAASLGGNHVWSFFGSDVADADRALLAPLVVHAWRAYDIAFPAHARTLDATYYSITSDRLDAVVRERLPAHAVMTGRRVLA
ncbi:FAD-dependent oxidoreductase, partial [Escherichia coli]|nr:FAD-dependent oxidoreductase [Escherichia coli]